MSRRGRAFWIHNLNCSPCVGLFDNYAYKMCVEMKKSLQTTKDNKTQHTHMMRTSQRNPNNFLFFFLFFPQFQYIIVLFPVCVLFVPQFTDDCLKRQFDNKIWVDGKKFETHLRIFIFKTRTFSVLFWLK